VKRLSDNDMPRLQARGYFDEHLITLNAQVYGDPYIYEDTYLVYHDPLCKMLWLTLFELNGHQNHVDRLECLKTSMLEFEPRKMTAASPEKLEQSIGDYECVSAFSDKDYQIKLDEFDENLRGGSYDSLRYHVNNATKRGYSLSVGKEMATAHAYIMSLHMSKRNYNPWDYQLFLRLQNYVGKSTTAKIFNVLCDDLLIGFDVVDFLGNTMATPLGFCLDYPSLADFMMHKEIVYAKEQNYEWLDIGWACSSGLEEFKKKWKGVPRFNIIVQEYINKNLLANREKLPGQITLQTAAVLPLHHKGLRKISKFEWQITDIERINSGSQTA